MSVCMDLFFSLRKSIFSALWRNILRALCPWTPLGDFRPSDPLLVPLPNQNPGSAPSIIIIITVVINLGLATLLWLSGYSTKAGGVLWPFVLSFCLSVSRITHDRCNRRRPNMVGVGKGWPSLLIFSCWSRPACGFWITFPFSSSLRNRGF